MSLGWEVGGWVASAVIGNLVDKVCSYISNQFEFDANIEHKLKCLEEDLTKIKAVLHEADQRRIENPHLKKWLLNLKDATYDVEDALDMFEYKILQDKVEGKADQVGSTLQRLRKRARATTITIFNDYLNKFYEVVERFRKIVADKEDLIELIRFQPTISHKVSELMQLRETTSMPIESELFGRDKERTQLMNLILQQSGGGDDGGASSSRNVHVLPIVGMGGVGKTTLVQDVYNNSNVKNHFDFKAWVCVSDNFDVKRLAKEIIQSSASILQPELLHTLQNFDRTYEILKSGLIEKRFLIVLDDVWNEVATKWDQLWRILNIGKEGSRVIVTTRSKQIARMMRTEDVVTLECLADDEFWRLFVRCAFGDENPANYPGLEFVGKQIAQKLGGNPLAAKTVGALLKYDLNFHHWREVLDSKLWQTDQQEDGIMSVLGLSYEYLPYHLKQCFIFCSLFPKDYKFSMVEIVQLWRAHEYILPNERNNNIEKIGETYFNELLRKSFIQEAYSGLRGKYVIHDLLHDLAQYLSGGEIFIADNKDVEIPVSVRHLSICANDLSLIFNGKFAKENLRSLVVFDYYYQSLDFLREMEGLRVLVLHDFDGELSSAFHKMLHLRYLELKPRVLPAYVPYVLKSLCKLYHMQFALVLVHGHVVHGHVVWPEDINRFINLRSLGTCTGEIAWIGKLTLLEKLDFHVNKKKSGFEIRQLRDMTQLRELRIYGLESVESKEQASEAMLGNKQHLIYLKLYWSGHVDDYNGGGEVLEGLQPHQNLEELDIGCPGGNTPSWWNRNWTSYLLKITLRFCSKWKFLPPMGQLPLLKELYLDGMSAVKRIGPEFYGINTSALSSSTTVFPSLEKLIIWRLFELTECIKVEDGLQLFPRLSHVEVSWCPKLRGSLSHFLPSQFRQLFVAITEKQAYATPDRQGKNKGLIRITCRDLLILTELIPYDNLASVEVLKISRYHMRPLHASRELERWFQHLTSLQSLCFQYGSGMLLPFDLIRNLFTLQELEIIACNNIKSLPEGLPTSLQVLKIFSCHRLKSLPEEGLPTSLQVLDIRRCHELEEACREDGPEWHKIAHVPTIKISNDWW